MGLEGAQGLGFMGGMRTWPGVQETDSRAGSGPCSVHGQRLLDASGQRVFAVSKRPFFVVNKTERVGVGPSHNPSSPLGKGWHAEPLEPRSGVWV